MLNILRLALGACLAFGLQSFAMATEIAAPKGEVLLTVSGLIKTTNVDGTLQLDLAQLEALPVTEFTTSTTWTTGTPTFHGVLLRDLLAAAGATGGTITLRAVNDYAVTIPAADVADDAPLLAFLVDGKTMSLRDKGPVWLVYPYDQKEKYRSEETYSRSIWQLTDIEIGQ